MIVDFNAFPENLCAFNSPPRPFLEGGEGSSTQGSSAPLLSGPIAPSLSPPLAPPAAGDDEDSAEQTQIEQTMPGPEDIVLDPPDAPLDEEPATDDDEEEPPTRAVTHDSGVARDSPLSAVQAARGLAALVAAPVPPASTNPAAAAGCEWAELLVLRLYHVGVEYDCLVYDVLLYVYMSC